MQPQREKPDVERPAAEGHVVDDVGGRFHLRRHHANIGCF
jgi:hypothetical protein